MTGVIIAPIALIVRFLWQTVFLALAQVWANKTRSMLTALGIIIGVWAVISVMSGLNGMRGFVLAEFEKFGARKMWVWGEVPDNKRAVMSWTDVKLSVYEANLLLDKAPSVETLTPVCNNSWPVTAELKRLPSVRVSGIWPEWHTIEDRQVLYGRPFSRIDDDERRQVCLINDQGIEELGLDIDPTGDYLLLAGRRFLIVGVVETKDAGGFGGGQARTELFIPFSTHKMMNPYTWTNFMVQMVSPDVSEDAQAEIRFILRNHRDLQPEDEDTFGMFVLQDEIQQFNAVAGVIGAIAFGVVVISLVVGGIGIMNIMLVSVSERTREIGLRKAMGAKPPIVLCQFLVEAVVLCVVGGLIGLIFAVATVAVLSNLPQLSALESTEVSKFAVVLAIGFSALVGVVFGMGPAIKASRLNPIDALRHE
jgi:putative ABC transport system permease protein